MKTKLAKSSTETSVRFSQMVFVNTAVRSLPYFTTAYGEDRSLTVPMPNARVMKLQLICMLRAEDFLVVAVSPTISLVFWFQNNFTFNNKMIRQRGPQKDRLL